MEIITKEYKVYNFKELDKEVQEKLIEKEKRQQNEFYCDTFLQEDMNCSASCLLEKYFGKDTKLDNVYYDLSYSQGSGSMIEFTINIEDLNNKYHILSSEEMKFIKDISLVDDIKVYHDDNYYVHEYTFNIKYDDCFGYYDYEDIKDSYNISEEDFNTIEDRIINLLDCYNKHYTKSKFIEDIISMNKELTKDGYKYVEYEISDDEAISFLEDDKYLEDGTIF